MVQGNKQSRSQSIVPLDQRSENESSGSIHFQITIEITEFCISGFTAQCAVCIYGIYGACLKWMLPELSFPNRWSRGTKLWERDWAIKHMRNRVETAWIMAEIEPYSFDPVRDSSRS